MADDGMEQRSPLDRRVLAIMATDVVGYSRQMEADEAGTIARVTTARAEVIEPLLARHHGQLVKLIGDGTLSVFDSVVDAVACAAAIQRGMRERNQRAPEAEQMVLRIGVNLGDVALLENDVYGDGVNVAARIEALCDPGGIMVSGTAYDHLQGKVDFPLEFAGEQRMKNINRPVRTYRARLEGVAVPTRRRPMPLRSLAAAATALLFAGGGWWVWSTWSAPPANASIAVLPFDNLGGDEATGRLADGITEDLITELTRFRGLDVIAREATRPYKGQTVDIQAVGQRAARPLRPRRDHPAAGRAGPRDGAAGRDGGRARRLVGALGPAERRLVRGAERGGRGGGEQDREPLFRRDRRRRAKCGQAQAAQQLDRVRPLSAGDGIGGAGESRGPRGGDPAAAEEPGGGPDTSPALGAASPWPTPAWPR